MNTRRTPPVIRQLPLLLLLLCAHASCRAGLTFAEIAETGFAGIEALFKEAVKNADHWDEFNEAVMELVEKSETTMGGAIESSAYLQAVDLVFDLQGSFRKLSEAGQAHGVDGLVVQASAEIFRVSALPLGTYAGMLGGVVFGRVISAPWDTVTPFFCGAFGAAGGFWLFRGWFDEYGMNKETLAFLAEEVAAFRTLFLRLGADRYEEVKEASVAAAVALDVEVDSGRMETVRVIRDSMVKVTEIVKAVPAPASWPAWPSWAGGAGGGCADAVAAADKLLDSLDEALIPSTLPASAAHCRKAAAFARDAANAARACGCSQAERTFQRAADLAGQAAAAGDPAGLRGQAASAKITAGRAREQAGECR